MMRLATHSPSSAINAAAARWIARRDAGWSATEQAEFERWRAADSRHAQALAQYDHTWLLFDAPREAGTAEAIWRELGIRRRRRLQRRIRYTLSGIAVLIAGAFVVQTRVQSDGVSREPIVARTAAIIVPETWTLPDGSVVELKTGAEIAVDFQGMLRRVFLRRGEAHFQVAPDKARPFLVSVGSIDVRAVGTAFTVQLAANKVEVLVTEGRIAVELPVVIAGSFVTLETAPSALAPFAVVVAGNRVLVDLPSDEGSKPAARVAEVPPEEIEERLAWRATHLEFSGTPLAEAVALINQHNRLQFVIGDRALSSVELSGFFRADNTEAFLRVLEATFAIKGERSGETAVLRRAR